MIRAATPRRCGLPGLETPVAVRHRVAHDGDLPAGVDPLRLEPVIVLGVSAVGVDDLGGDVSGRRHAEVRGSDVGGIRVLVLRVAVLLQREAARLRRDHRHRDLAGQRQQHVVAADRDLLEAVLDEPGPDVVRELPVPLGPGRMRRLGQDPEVPCGARGIEEGRQPSLERALSVARRGRETGDRAAVRFGLTGGRHPRARDQQEADNGQPGRLHGPLGPAAVAPLR